MWQLCWSWLHWPSHVILMDHQGCNDTPNLLCGPVLAWLSTGDDPVTYCTDIIVPTVDSHQQGQLDCICEWDLSCKEKWEKEVDWVMQQWALCHKEKSYHGNTKTRIRTWEKKKKKTCTIQPGISYTSYKWITLMFWAFRQSRSALLCVCAV